MAGDKVVGCSSHLSKEKIHQENTYNENLNLEEEFAEPIEYVPCPEFHFSVSFTNIKGMYLNFCIYNCIYIVFNAII